MKPVLRRAIACIVSAFLIAQALPAAASAVLAQDPPATRPRQSAPSGVQRASGVLRLEGPGAGVRPPARGYDIKTVGEIISSTTFVDAAAKEALGLEPEQWPKVAQIELAPAGEQALKLIVTVRPGGEIELPQQPAAALRRELSRRAQAEVERVAANPEQSAQLMKQINELAQRKETLTSRARQLEMRMNSLREQRGESPVRPPQSQGQVQMLLEQIARNRLRLEAIESVLADWVDIQKQLRGPGNELVALHEQRVALLQKMVENGQATPLQVLDAQIALGEARRQGLQQAGGSVGPLERYINEVISLRVEIAVAEAQLEKLGVATTTPATQPATQPTTQPANSGEQLSTDVDALTRQLNETRQELAQVSNDLTQAQRRLEELGPPVRLVIVDGSE